MATSVTEAESPGRVMVESAGHVLGDLSANTVHDYQVTIYRKAIGFPDVTATKAAGNPISWFRSRLFNQGFLDATYTVDSFVLTSFGGDPDPSTLVNPQGHATLAFPRTAADFPPIHITRTISQPIGTPQSSDNVWKDSGDLTFNLSFSFFTLYDTGNPAFSSSQVITDTGQTNTLTFTNLTGGTQLVYTDPPDALNLVGVYNFTYSAHGTGSCGFTDELDYEGFMDSLLASVPGILAQAAIPNSPLGYCFNDVPYGKLGIYDYLIGAGATTNDDYPLDPSVFTPYDGSIQPAQFNTAAAAVGSGGSTFIYRGDASLDYTSNLPYPALAKFAYSSVGYHYHLTEDQGGGFYGIVSAGVAIISLPSIFATFIVMEDATLVFDSFSGDQVKDVARGGKQAIPVPRMAGLPAFLFTTDAAGVKRGPIGRITAVIPNTTKATWNGIL